MKLHRILSVCFIVGVLACAGIVYAVDLNNFAITAGKYSETENLEQIVQNEFGSNYRIADWNDIVNYHNDGGNAVDFENHFGAGAMLTYSGSHWYSSSRHYLYTISHRPGQTPHSGYLSHANINNHEFDLGSWYGLQQHILVYKEQSGSPTSCSHNAAPSQALGVVDFPASVTPANNQVQVCACDDIMIQPILAIPSSDVGKTATLIMYMYLADSNFGINIPSKTVSLTSETKFDLLPNAIDLSDSAGLNVYIYYGYIAGSTIKYNAYSVVVGSFCDNAVPKCEQFTSQDDCMAAAGCTWYYVGPLGSGCTTYEGPPPYIPNPDDVLPHPLPQYRYR